MAEEEITEEYSAYVDWMPPPSNSTSPDDHRTLSSVGDAVICIVTTILSVVTTGGNLLVVVSFKMDRNLQTVSNYFLLSLSVADFIIGAVSMPLYTTFLVLGYWPLGQVFCDVWLSLDYTISNASVANLLVISFDRYMSVTRPLTYRVRRTRRRAAAMIAGAWVVSALLWTPWIVAWPFIEGRRTVPVGDCYIQFLKSNKYLTIATAVAAFYLPVVILCVVYHRIYRETRRHQRNIYELQAAVRRRLHADSVTALRSGYGNTADENPGCLGGCRKRLASVGRQTQRGRCRSGERDGGDKGRGNFDEDTTIPMRDDGLSASTTRTLMSKSQSVPCETQQTVVVNSVSDVTIASANQSVNSTISSMVPPGQCQCSWHGGNRREDLTVLPSSSRHPAFVLTVEFAGDSIEVDITTTNNEVPQDSCLLTEEPDTLQVFPRRISLQISSIRHLDFRTHRVSGSSVRHGEISISFI